MHPFTHLKGHLNHGHVSQQNLEAHDQFEAVIAAILDEFVEQRDNYGGASVRRLWCGTISATDGRGRRLSGGAWQRSGVGNCLQMRYKLPARSWFACGQCRRVGGRGGGRQ